MSPFAAAALELHALGLCPIPCGGDDSKMPLVKSASWRNRPSQKAISSWLRSATFANANIGILTGLSRITVIDVDDPNDFQRSINLFGPTPLVTATPSGGRHYWYRSNLEGCHNLRDAGLCADVKGLGGFIVVPPSFREAGCYEFISGAWTSLDVLPFLGPRGLQLLTARSVKESKSASKGSAAQKSPLVHPGNRNRHIFDRSRLIAKGCDSLEELLQDAEWINEQECTPPLEQSELLKTVESAWRYEVLGQNFARGGGFHCANYLVDIIGDPDAFWLFQYLKRFHSSKYADAPFAVSPRAMATAGCAAPMRESRIRKARDRLLEVGILLRIHEGGRFDGDPALFKFGRLDRLRNADG